MNTDTVMNLNSAETTTATAISSVAVKVSRGDEMRRFNFKGQSFTELKTIISELFSIPSEDFSLQYQDDEKDRVTLSSDAELKEAIQLHKYVLRFFVNLTNKPAVVGEVPLQFAMPYHPHHHHHAPHHHRHIHHHGVPPPPPHVMDAAAVPSGEAGEAAVPPHHPHHGHHGGRHGGRHGQHGPYGRPHGGHKRFLDKEEKEAIKCEKRRWKKQRKCESSSSSSCSSSSEDEAQKVQRKEMRQLMKATKESIKANWAPTKKANPGQWAENRKVMMAEIKLAKRMIREQAKKQPSSPSVAPAEQNTPVVTTAAAEMQA